MASGPFLRERPVCGHDEWGQLASEQAEHVRNFSVQFRVERSYAEDVFQAALLRCLQSDAVVRDHKGYLYRAMRNLYIEWIRKSDSDYRTLQSYGYEEYAEAEVEPNQLVKLRGQRPGGLCGCGQPRARTNNGHGYRKTCGSSECVTERLRTKQPLTKSTTPETREANRARQARRRLENPEGRNANNRAYRKRKRERSQRDS